MTLNGNQLGAAQPDQEIAANFQDPPDAFSSSNAAHFVPGLNTIDIDVRNFGGPIGLDFKIDVTYCACPDRTTLSVSSGSGAVGALDPAVTFSQGGGPFQPALIVAPQGSYSTIPGSQWVTVTPNATSAPNQVVRFRASFTLPVASSTASISGSLHADNAAITPYPGGGLVTLNGNQLGTAQPDQAIAANFQDPPDTFSSANPAHFVVGLNTVEVQVHNFGGPIGLDLRFQVTFCACDAVPTIVGTPGNDAFITGPGNDVVAGLGGNDAIISGPGDDVLIGGPGDDVLDAREGNDVVCGGPGNDSIAGRSGDDFVTGGDGDDRIAGDDGNDYLLGDLGNDAIHGGAPTGPVGSGDRIDGGAGNDACVSPAIGGERGAFSCP